jgi:hypothetical protein
LRGAFSISASARHAACALVNILRKLGKLQFTGTNLEDFFRDLLNEVEDLYADRCFVAHGTWGTLMPEGIPIAMSLRERAERGEIISETFPSERMLKIVNDTVVAKLKLVGVRDGLAASRDKTREPPPLAEQSPALDR